ncbi:MmcQ/YjbR family DNA-binding protein [Nonomuraea sp. NPDC049784]|uniref:MmcQ/YjbR family DNA-binding protein n=1 Tax=Nonomuraea sp. NPDC049784 TaxID=3154361 RepID=UPI0033D95F92
MITLDDIRRFATALPEVEEVTHFRLPSFKVSGKPFAGMEKGDATAVFSVSQQEAATAVAEDAGAYAEVWRTASTKIWVGLRVDLAKVSHERIQELVEHAWRNKAPKRVVAAYDALAGPDRSARRVQNEEPPRDQ